MSVNRNNLISIFMMKSDNTLELKQIFDCSDIEDTMRYAHFAPDHLDDAITKKPIAGLLTQNG